MSTSADLKAIFTAGRPLVEGALDIAEQIAALRDVATQKGLDWSQVKALLKAQIQDERDKAGSGKRVKRIVEKADFACAYADMLGLGNMNEKNYSRADQDILEPPPNDRVTGTVQFGNGPVVSLDDEKAVEAVVKVFVAAAYAESLAPVTPAVESAGTEGATEVPAHDPATGEIIEAGMAELPPFLDRKLRKLAAVA